MKVDGSQPLPAGLGILREAGERVGDKSVQLPVSDGIAPVRPVIKAIGLHIAEEVSLLVYAVEVSVKPQKTVRRRADELLPDQIAGSGGSAERGIVGAVRSGVGIIQIGAGLGVQKTGQAVRGAGAGHRVVLGGECVGKDGIGSGAVKQGVEQLREFLPAQRTAGFLLPGRGGNDAFGVRAVGEQHIQSVGGVSAGKGGLGHQKTVITGKEPAGIGRQQGTDLGIIDRIPRHRRIGIGRPAVAGRPSDKPGMFGPGGDLGSAALFHGLDRERQIVLPELHAIPDGARLRRGLRGGFPERSAVLRAHHAAAEQKDRRQKSEKN